MQKLHSFNRQILQTQESGYLMNRALVDVSKYHNKPVRPRDSKSDDLRKRVYDGKMGLSCTQDVQEGIKLGRGGITLDK